MKYLFIFEDGTLSQADTIPDAILNAWEDGLYTIVDMETGLVYTGPDKWTVIETVA